MQDGFWLVVNVFIVPPLIVCPESDSNYIVPQYCYHCSCDVDFTIRMELERLLKLYSYQPWCEWSLSLNFQSENG